MATETEPLSAKEAALELKTDARTLRKFLRKRNGLVGQGQRWEIQRKELPKLKKEFDAWASGTAPKKDKDSRVEPPTDDLDDDDNDEGLDDIDELLDEVDDDLEEI